jgi:hypothetical protein
MTKNKDLYASTTTGVAMEGDRKIPAPPRGLIARSRKAAWLDADESDLVAIGGAK